MKSGRREGKEKWRGEKHQWNHAENCCCCSHETWVSFSFTKWTAWGMLFKYLCLFIEWSNMYHVVFSHIHLECLMVSFSFANVHLEVCWLIQSVPFPFSGVFFFSSKTTIPTQWSLLSWQLALLRLRKGYTFSVMVLLGCSRIDTQYEVERWDNK